MNSNKLLMKIAMYTGIFGTSGCVYFFLKIQNSFRNSPYFTESMRLLQEHSGAVGYLGKPLKFGYVDLGTDYNFCDGFQAQFEVPVKGSKKSGKLFLWARRETAQDSWDIYRLEFSPASPASLASKRFTIKQQEES